MREMMIKNESMKRAVYWALDVLAPVLTGRLLRGGGGGHRERRAGSVLNHELHLTLAEETLAPRQQLLRDAPPARSILIHCTSSQRIIKLKYCPCTKIYSTTRSNLFYEYFKFERKDQLTCTTDDCTALMSRTVDWHSRYCTTAPLRWPKDGNYAFSY